MIDFATYKQDKEAGALEVQRVGTRAVLFLRSFDPKSGTENAPQMAQLNPTDLLKARAAAQAAVDGINALIADVKALGVEVAAE